MNTQPAADDAKALTAAWMKAKPDRLMCNMCAYPAHPKSQIACRRCGSRGTQPREPWQHKQFGNETQDWNLAQATD